MPLNRNTKIIREDFLAWVRRRPCVMCGVYGVQAMHVKARGLGEGKRVDLLALPGCAKHHREQENKGWEAVETKYKFSAYEEVSWALIEFFLDQERNLERIA